MWCPAPGMNTTKIECLIPQAKHVSFERRMAESVREPHSAVASNAKTAICGFARK